MSRASSNRPASHSAPCLLRQAADWHLRHMDDDPRYAQTLVEGAVRLLWQRDPASAMRVVGETAVRLFLIVRSTEIE